MLNVKQESCKYQFLQSLVDPTGNRTRVYRFSSRRSIHSTTDRFKYVCRLADLFRRLEELTSSRRVVPNRDVEAVKFLMLPLPAPLEVLCFRVRFRFLTFGIFCFCFQVWIELVASEFASASSLFQSKCFRFHKNVTAFAFTSMLNMKQLIGFSVKKTGKFTL